MRALLLRGAAEDIAECTTSIRSWSRYSTAPRGLSARATRNARSRATVRSPRRSRGRIQDALTHHGGQMAATARALDLERSYLYKKARALGLRNAEKGEEDE